ncbi:9809_t:CDS:2, partial [Gigaspora margarita]
MPSNTVIGCTLTEGTNIEEAIQNLSRTSVARIEPNRNQNDIKPNRNQNNIEPNSESL